MLRLTVFKVSWLLGPCSVAWREARSPQASTTRKEPSQVVWLRHGSLDEGVSDRHRQK
jgi:hypothetical protein